MGYSFELLGDDFSAGHIRRTVEALEANLSDGWPCWAISNHDVERVLTRWGRDQPSPQLANLLAAMVCSLRGSVCVYQGEELGLTEAELPYESLQDPYGIAFWPQFKGRDGCRTPMPWNEADAHAGFSRGTPWLPVPSEHRAMAVSRQDADPHSVLNGFRAFMRWRKSQPALRWGDIAFIDTAEPVLAFTRRLDGQTVLVVFNLAGAPVDIRLPAALGQPRPLDGHGLLQGHFDGGQLRLPGYGACFASVE
jgi:alpha-glucosidase